MATRLLEKLWSTISPDMPPALSARADEVIE
jgi:hypothetical protein